MISFVLFNLLTVFLSRRAIQLEKWTSLHDTDDERACVFLINSCDRSDDAFIKIDFNKLKKQINRDSEQKYLNETNRDLGLVTLLGHSSIQPPRRYGNRYYEWK